MTTLLLDHPVDSSVGADAEVCYCVLTIERMPIALRAGVEALMVLCVPSQPLAALPGADPLSAHWCTRWERAGRGLTGCREVLAAPRAELRRLAAALRERAEAEGFYASVEEVSSEEAKLPSPKGSSQQSTRSATESSTRVGR
ncbi:hypothetical protein MHT86_08520 [Corynebacterium mastitidis]|uniref:hypothetical protein n=1 Tax=Corynebacterium mastitidis TaxID=161890 RepID=UPI0012FF16BD|nr:hypothetical protein [Corynebacterium mastitidis]MCH6197537.1 hypothetical protein [Corynebacterium mastitidis]